MKARIIIGANYGDEGKGRVTAEYTKNSDNVLNVLTNGGAQRAHSILTESGNITFQHFGAGTYHGADNYYSRFFILNPMQFVKEYNELPVKPKNIYRDIRCRWSTPYDSMANLITEQQLQRKASCGMGIWNTIKRYYNMPGVSLSLDEFVHSADPFRYLSDIKGYYEKNINVPDSWKEIWNSPYMMLHFYEDCKFMAEHTSVMDLSLLKYENIIFENGQGLLLCDTGKDTPDTTPSNTGILYSKVLLDGLDNVEDVTVHYVTRPYLTRHGDGFISDAIKRDNLSSAVQEDRTNHFNEFQGEFRYGKLNIEELKNRIVKDAGQFKFEVELTHCDEMDRVSEFKDMFQTVNIYKSAMV